MHCDSHSVQVRLSVNFSQILFPYTFIQSESAEEELAEADKLMAEQEAVNDEHRRRIGEVLGDAEPLKV